MFIIEDYMIKDLNLSGNDLVLYAYITTQGVCEESLPTLMTSVGVKSINTIRSSLKCLEDKGLITITTRGNKPSIITAANTSNTTTKGVEEVRSNKINPREILRRGTVSRRSVLD